VDKQLLGVWGEVEKKNDKDDDENKPDRFKVDPKPNSKVAMMVTNLDSNDKEPPLTLLATRLGERRYLSLGGRNKDKDRLEWLIAEYKWTDKDILQLRLFDPKRVRKAIEAGAIKGKIEERQQLGDDGQVRTKDTAMVWIEESTENLRQYLERHPEQLFATEWGTFKRVEPGRSTKSAGNQ
jgi:hypothetical protein